MKIGARPLQSKNDKLLMAGLARQFAGDHLHVTDLPYRLSSWALDDPHNARLWFDEDGGLAAWAVLNSPFWTIDMACHPQAEAEVHAEVIAWADRRAREIIDSPYGHPLWFMDVFTGQTQRIADLEQAGFKNQADVGEDSLSKVLMRRSVQTPVKVYHPPEGFTVRPLAGQSEVEGYVELHRAVFESKSMTVEWRRRTLEHPAYRPDLDIVVADPAGRLGAFCICWLDEETHSGRVEPLGCHQDFRRYALGRVALSAGLARLQAAGAQDIFVETDHWRNTAFRLYEFFDFQVIQEVFVFRKDY